MTDRKTPVCPHCGSAEITIDAIARWDEVGQLWVVSSLLDIGSCDDCGEEFDAGDISEAA